MRRRKTTTATDEAEDKDNYCCHEVTMMMMKRRKRRKRRSRMATTRMDDDKDYCRAVPNWVLYTRRTSSRERRGRYIGITIRIVPTGQYIIHDSQYTILIATSSQMVVILSPVYVDICTNITRLYRTINSIAQ